ncbi:hypothetical protein ABZS88_10030 [Streptomyces sp. NPDC005480]
MAYVLDAGRRCRRGKEFDPAATPVDRGEARTDTCDRPKLLASGSVDVSR